MKYLWHNKILILVLLLFILMFPTTISLPQQSRSENIVTAVGIDKMGEEYEVSLQYLIPYAGSSENALKCASMKGKSVGEAIEKFNLDFGKVSGFAHCRVIVFNKEASDDNLNEALDYLQRIKTNTNNIFLVSTEKSAKELLDSVKDLNSEFYVILSRDSVAGQHNHYESLRSFGDYYDAILGPVKCIAINNINVEEDTSSSSNGGASAGGGSGSGESSGGGGSNGDSSSSSGSTSGGGSGGGSGSSSTSSSTGKASKIKNDGSLTIIKNAKRLLTLTAEESDSLNWFNSKVKDMTLRVSGFSDEIYKNADITFDVYKRFTSVDTYFVDGKPVYRLNLLVDVTIIEAAKESLKSDEFVPANNLFSDKLKTAVVSEIKNKLRNAESNFRQNKYDVVDCYEHFYKYNNKQFKEYLKTLSETDYFLDNVIFEYNVRVRQWD